MKNKKINEKLSQALSKGKDRVWQSITDEIPELREAESKAVLSTGETVAVKKLSAPAFIAVAIAFMLALTLILIPILNGNGSPSLPIQFDGSSCFYVDVNPSVQVKLDESGRVTEVNPLNDDAQILLASAKDSLVGMSADDAAVQIFELAYQTGYISPLRKNNALLISGALADEDSNSRFNDNVKKSVMKRVSQKGVYCAVLTSTSDSLLKEYAAVYGITVGKYQLIQAAIALGAVIEETEFSTISVAEINARTAAASDKLEECGTKEYYEAMEELNDLAEEHAEALIEKLEDAIENVEDYIEDLDDENKEDLAERDLERLENILDNLENRAEDGKPLNELFDKLKAQAAELGQADWADDNIRTLIGGVIAEIETVEGEFKTLYGNIANAKQELQNKHQNRVDSAQSANQGYSRPTNFDDDYEDWLEDVYDDYLNNWSQMKADWESSLSGSPDGQVNE